MNKKNGDAISANLREVYPARPVGIPRRSEPAQTSMPLFALWNSLRRRWWTAFPIAICLATAGGLAGWKFIKPTYSASAFIRIAPATQRLAFETADQNDEYYMYRLYKNTQQQLITSMNVLTVALRNEPALNKLPEISQAEFPEQVLQQAIRVTFPTDSEIMQVTCNADSGTTTILMLKAVVNAYMSEVVGNEMNLRKARQVELEGAFRVAEEKLVNKKEALKTYAAQFSLSATDTLTEAQKLTLQQYARVLEQSGDTEFSIMQTEGELQIAEELFALFKAEQAEPTEAAVIDTSADLARAQIEITRAESRYEAARRTFGPGHPSLVRLDQEVQLSRKLYQDLRRHLEVRIEFEKKDSGGSDPFKILSLRKSLAVQNEHRQILQQKVDKLESEIQSLGRDSIEIELMRSEIDELNAVLSGLRSEMERTNIELRSTSRISLADKLPDVPRPPDEIGKLKKMAAMALFGFLLPFFGLVVWDLSSRRVDGSEPVELALSIGNLGTLPKLRRSPYAGRPLSRQRMFDFHEAGDALAAMVMHRAREEGSKLLMVTSAVTSEGKSTVSCQLAEALARAGLRVALVDFDLRRPALAEYLQLNDQPGVADILHDELRFEECEQATSTPNLVFLAAGYAERPICDFVTNGKLEELLADLRQDFDFVILDSGPVLPVVDTRIMSKLVDSVILTLQRDVSRLPLAVKAVKTLLAYGARILGTVVIGDSSERYGPSYQNYYRKRDPGLSESSARNVIVKS